MIDDRPQPLPLLICSFRPSASRIQVDVTLGDHGKPWRDHVLQVKREDRLPHHPRTPSPADRTSKRHFDRTIGEWRRALHHWAETDSDRGQAQEAHVVPIRLSSYLDLDQ